MQTRLCELLDIEVPIVQAAIWPATTPELVAEVNRAGAIGSLGAVFAPADRLEDEIHRTEALTDRPFIVNHVVPQLDEDAFEATLAASPAAVSFALGHPGELVDRVHGVGAKVIHQVHTVQQAREAAELGVDAIIAQGSEAGGQGMVLGSSTLTLVPQVVDAVAPIPVIAAGGIADGRGFAAVLAAGAAGANVGTRFLASEEARSTPAWRESIVASESEDAVRFEAWGELFPRTSEDAYAVVPRVLRTEFLEQIWDRDDARSRVDDARTQIGVAIRERATDDLVPFTGQSAGLVRDVLPAAEIVNRMVEETRAVAEQLRAVTAR
jgi:nitronate monooxygenase/enoyl-[acyl-carrier protein] reductase II